MLITKCTAETFQCLLIQANQFELNFQFLRAFAVSNAMRHSQTYLLTGHSPVFLHVSLSFAPSQPQIYIIRFNYNWVLVFSSVKLLCCLINSQTKSPLQLPCITVLQYLGGEILQNIVMAITLIRLWLSNLSSFSSHQVPSVLVGYVLFFGIGGYLHVIPSPPSSSPSSPTSPSPW